jgi:hypothetical protein
MQTPQSKEDREIIKRGEILRSLVEGEGWAIAKTILDAEIDKIKLVSTLDLTAPIEEIGKEAFARAKAIQTIQVWYNNIQSEIETLHTNLDIAVKDSPNYIREVE